MAAEIHAGDIVGGDRSPTHRVSEQALTAFTSTVLCAAGVRESDAAITAAVLVASDVRGISSHGVARLAYYLAMIEAGTLDPCATPTIARESATTAVLDAHNGLGQPVGVRAMTLAIEKAAAHDVGIVTVRHSNHYGIAGYYAMMALERDMIGVSLTNTHTAVAPTGGRRPTIGTNPIAIAVPTSEVPHFVLDMATSVVPRGRLEVAVRQGISIPAGWSIDARGVSTTSPEAGLDGALLPLGGPIITSGYKGYGLAVAIELLSAVLPGSLYGPLVAPMWDTAGPSDLGQFFMAINIAAFDDPVAFKARASDLLRRIKTSPLAEGATEILVAGEKEARATLEARRHGILLEAKVVAELAELAARYKVPLWDV
jgi:LDH2 family malate/lactate/ureidoglycolate dehydrogenase